MRKYTKKELEKIMLESIKYLIAQFILQKISKDSIKFLNLLKIENLGDFLIFYDSLENIEKNMLKMNVSAPTSKFLKDFEKLWIQEKQNLLKKEDFSLTLWTSIAENLKLE